MAHTHITPGWEIEMSAHYYPDKKADRVAELIQLPREELTTMEEASVAQEKAIFSKFSEIEAEWLKQAAETIAIRKAREYLRALPVEHTSNQWKVNQFGWNVLSNMVYKMSYRVSENKTPDGTLINCTLSWDIHYNTLQHPTPDYTGDGWKIAGQSDKRFATKEELEQKGKQSQKQSAGKNKYPAEDLLEKGRGSGVTEPVVGGQLWKIDAEGTVRQVRGNEERAGAGTAG